MANGEYNNKTAEVLMKLVEDVASSPTCSVSVCGITLPTESGRGKSLGVIVLQDETENFQLTRESALSISLVIAELVAAEMEKEPESTRMVQ